MPLTLLGQVRFMLSNDVVAVDWEFLKTTPTGDMYRFTRKIPAEPTIYSDYPASRASNRLRRRKSFTRPRTCDLAGRATADRP